MTIKGKTRIHWMDNLRTVIIFLVVLYHVGGVYESGGLWGWFWIVDDPDTITWVGIVGIMFDVMVMPILFFISGYLAPVSMKNKTGWQFIWGKVKRLLFPWVIAVLTLIPLYKVIFRYSRGMPQESWTTYFHITNPNSQNWLWFLPVLFTFNLVYLALSRANIKLPEFSLKTTVIGSSVIGFAYSVVVGLLFGFRSWTLTPLIDFENERLLVYFLAFLLGVLSFRRNVFAEKPERKTLYMVANYTAWLPVTAHIFARIYPFFFAVGFTVTPLYIVFWHLSFHLSLLCLAYIMIESFWRYLDRSGKVWQELNQNSYGVYIIHVILIGVFGTLLLKTDLPAVVKYLLLIVSTYLGSNLVVSLYRLVHKYLNTGLKKMLPGE